MPKLLSCLFGLVLLFSMSGCGSKPAPDPKAQAEEAKRLDKRVAEGEGSL